MAKFMEEDTLRFPSCKAQSHPDVDRDEEITKIFSYRYHRNHMCIQSTWKVFRGQRIIQWLGISYNQENWLSIHMRLLLETPELFGRNLREREPKNCCFEIVIVICFYSQDDMAEEIQEM